MTVFDFRAVLLSLSPLFVPTTDEVASMNSLVMRPLWVEERRLREWLNTGEGQESFIVNCEGGLLSVTVDQQSLQVFIIPKFKGSDKCR